MQRSGPSSPPQQSHAAADTKAQRDQAMMQGLVGMHAVDHGFLAGMKIAEEVLLSGFHGSDYSK